VKRRRRTRAAELLGIQNNESDNADICGRGSPETAYCNCRNYERNVYAGLDNG